MDEYAQCKQRLLEFGWPEQEVEIVVEQLRQEEERLSLGLCPSCGQPDCYRRCVRSSR